MLQRREVAGRDGEIVHAHVRATDRTGVALKDREAKLRAARTVHADPAYHEAIRIRGPCAIHNPVAVLMPDEEEHPLVVATRQRPHPLVHRGRVHARDAAQVAFVPVAQQDHRVHRWFAARKGAEGGGVRQRGRPVVRRRVAEEGQVAELGAKDEVLRAGDLQRVGVSREVVRLWAEAGDGVLPIELHETVPQVVAGSARGRAAQPEVVVADRCQERLGLGLRGQPAEELTAHAPHDVVEVVA
mmetsp:Transcript_106986/g.297946  ORF Transcript_106986/g.297946 Transcript_106986/m.297946 type:complete len:243 (+) Transcript_106986:326-1054(+)